MTRALLTAVSAGLTDPESARVPSASSSSASVSGVGVRCSKVTEEPVFDSDSSVSVGCSDSVSGVGALGFSCVVFHTSSIEQV